jgi:hypothetical protein
VVQLRSRDAPTPLGISSLSRAASCISKLNSSLGRPRPHICCHPPLPTAPRAARHSLLILLIIASALPTGSRPPLLTAATLRRKHYSACPASRPKTNKPPLLLTLLLASPSSYKLDLSCLTPQLLPLLPLRDRLAALPRPRLSSTERPSTIHPLPQVTLPGWRRHRLHPPESGALP